MLFSYWSSPWLFKIFFSVYLFLRETESGHEQGRGREREGGRESKAGSRLWAVSTEPHAGLKLMSCEIMPWAEVRCLTNWATQAPLTLTLLKTVLWGSYLPVLLECTRAWINSVLMWPMSGPGDIERNNQKQMKSGSKFCLQFSEHLKVDRCRVPAILPEILIPLLHPHCQSPARVLLLHFLSSTTSQGSPLFLYLLSLVLVVLPLSSSSPDSLSQQPSN